MRYALLVCSDDRVEVTAAERERRVTAFTSFQDEMQTRGVLQDSKRLRPAETATTVRCWEGGDVVIADGPFAETKEQIGGFYIVDCKDLDEAIDVAARIPAAWYGSIEVRPVWEM
jgi:hypothetical protein